MKAPLGNAPRGRIRWLTATGLGLASMRVPMSYDEAFWLGTAKMVENGRVLYEGAIDNKTPPVYGLVWLVDIMPGSYQVWRGILIGLICWWLLTRLAQLATMALPTWGIRFVVVVVVLLAELQLATELVACALLVQGLASSRESHRPLLLASMVLAAVAFDPRVLTLIPGVWLVVRHRNPRIARPLGLILSAGLVMGAVIVLAIPGFRFALVELNLASRFTDLRPGPVQMLLSWSVPLAAFSPLFLWIDVRRRKPGVLALAVGAFAIAILSVLGIAHYWIYLAIPLVLLPVRTNRPDQPRLAVALAALALVPILAGTIGAVRLHLTLARTAGEVSEFLSQTLEPDDTYALFGAMPHLTVALPRQMALSSPTSNYLTDGTSRTDRYRSELSHALDDAAAIVDAGGLSVPREFVYERYRGTRDVFDLKLGLFPCERDFGTVIVRLRVDRCEPS